MVFERFRLGVVLQVSLILANCVTLAWLIAETAYYATVLLLLLLLGIQMALLFRYVQRTNRELARFMLAVRHADFSQTFSDETLTGSFAELGAALDEVLDRFRETRTEKEEQASYLQTLVEHVPVAVLAFDEYGDVSLFNKAARRMFGLSDIANLHRDVLVSEAFRDRLLALEPGDGGLIRFERDEETLQLNVRVTEFRMGGKSYKLISMQNIHGELEARELEAWQNLIRVLTHEIMNSVTPITSLATTAGELLAERGDASAAGRSEAILDARDAVDTIARRSAGLTRFVDSYRRLTRVPSPRVRRFRVAELFERLAQLMTGRLDERGIALRRVVAPRSLALDADGELLEQALINLLRNAGDALRDAADPAIELRGALGPRGRVVISVTDNGHGMEQSVIDSAFIPFFTTKRDGSGVGLSLVRQIVRLHHGAVVIESRVGEGTSVRLSF